MFSFSWNTHSIHIFSDAKSQVSCLKEVAIYLFPEPYESSPHSHSFLFKIQFIIFLTFTLRYSWLSQFFHFHQDCVSIYHSPTWGLHIPSVSQLL